MGKKWKTVIEPDSRIFDFHFHEVWEYRDLCKMFIRKNYITRYKQTVLGPIYMLLSPLITSGLFTVVFGMIAGLSTDGIPEFLFYMLGNLAWGFFSGCFYENNNTFGGNAYIMGKVYFPRLVVPLSNTLTKLINLIVQFVMFLLFYLIYVLKGMPIVMNVWVAAVPFFMLELAVMGVGIGMIVSSLTIKYRDLNVIIGFVMSLLFYASPVIYPLSNISGKLRTLALFNPIASIIEAIRYAFFGSGSLEPFFLVYSIVFTVIVVVTGLVLFNKVEKTFIDTI